MDGASLHLRHVFGYRNDIRENLSFVDNSSVIYAAGHNVVLHSFDDQTQIFCHSLNNDEAAKATICAIDVSASRRYCAVAERTVSGPRITILACTSEKMRRKRRLEKIPVEGEIVSIKFSPDERSLLVLFASDSEGTLVNFAWEKQRITHRENRVYRGKEPLYVASFCPMEPSLIVIIGRHFVRFLRIDGSDVRSVQTNLSKKDNHEFLCYSWDSEKRLLIGTCGAEVLIFEGNDYKGSFDVGVASPVHSVACENRGFVCGCEKGVLMIFERAEKEFYTHMKKLKFPENLNVNNLVLSPTHEKLAASLQGGQSYLVDLSHIELLQNSQIDQNTFGADIRSNCVSCLDICKRKPLIATCSSDKFVCIYNWMENRLVLRKKYGVEPFCVTIHPSGFYLVVGFADKLRLMNLYMDNIVEYCEFPMKNCSYVRFSNGGQYFAAVNAGSVQIYNTFECKNIANLRGHTGKVNSVTWSADDSRLTTSSNDSTVLEWDLITGTRLQDLTSKGCIYTSAVTTDKSEIICVGNDAQLKMVCEGKVTKSVNLGGIASQVEMNSSQTAVIVGMRNGDIRVFPLPLGSAEGIFLGAHSMAVTAIRVSDDGATIVTGSEDGSTCVFTARVPSGKRGKESALNYAEEILVEKRQLLNSKEELAKLTAEVKRTKENNDQELMERSKANKCEEEMKRIRYENVIDKETMMFEALQREKEEKIKEYQSRSRNIKSKEKDNREELDQYYKRKLEGESERYEELEKRFTKMREKQIADVEIRDESYAKEIVNMRKEFEENVKAVQQQGVEYDEQYEKTMREFHIVKKEVAENAEQEIEQIQSVFDDVMRQERSTTLDLKTANGMLKREFAGLKQKITSGNDKLTKRNNQLAKLDEETIRLDKDIEGLGREIKERQNTIEEKDRMIHDLRKKNQELEKFKFVLEYKINELDRQIQPRDQTIEEIRQQLEEMKQEVEEYIRRNQQCDLELADINLKLTTSLQEEKTQKRILKEISSIRSEYQEHLHECKQNVDDPNKLKSVVKRLYQSYGKISEVDQSSRKKESRESNRADPCTVFQRQRNFLKSKTESIQSQMELGKSKHAKKVRRYMKENSTLLDQLNSLRIQFAEQ